MKMIEAVIPPFTLGQVRTALLDAGVRGMTITEIQGFGAQTQDVAFNRAMGYPVDPSPRIKIQILAPDHNAIEVVEILAESGRRNKVGIGNISLIPVEEAVRIRTGERGSAAA